MTPSRSRKTAARCQSAPASTDSHFAGCASRRGMGDEQVPDDRLPGLGVRRQPIGRRRHDDAGVRHLAVARRPARPRRRRRRRPPRQLDRAHEVDRDRRARASRRRRRTRAARQRRAAASRAARRRRRSPSPRRWCARSARRRCRPACRPRSRPTCGSRTPRARRARRRRRRRREQPPASGAALGQPPRHRLDRVHVDRAGDSRGLLQERLRVGLGHDPAGGYPCRRLRATSAVLARPSCRRPNGRGRSSMSTTERLQAVAVPAGDPARPPLVSVVIPCLNEAENIERVRRRGARRRCAEHGIPGEVVVADNGSEDGSAELADRGRRARRRTSRAAATAAPTWPASPPRAARYIVMADADLTYDFNEIPRFVAAARGRRRAGHGRPHGQHPARARCRGCTATSATRSSPGILNLFFRTGVSDAHCGMRALRRDVLPRARPAHDRHGVRLRDGDPRRRRRSSTSAEFPIEYHPRGGESQALELPRRLAPPALPARAQPDAPVHRSRARCSLALGALIVAHRRCCSIDVLRPRVGPARDDRRARC